MNRFITFLCIIIIWTCKEKATLPFSSHTASDSIINSTIKEEKIMDDDSNLHDRTIWQRPYEIISMLGPLEDKIIADIGAGSGYFSFKFIHTAKKVIAIDIDKELIDLMNEEKNYYKEEINSKFEARLAKPYDPMLNKDEVDVVFLSNTYCYLTNRVSYLSNLKKCFKPKGRIMIVDFKKKITPIGPNLNIRLAQGEVEKELIDAGYRIEISDDSKLEYQYIIIASPID
ncbi:MAG: class I SAM-dependent methyltransferase [Saprospiraceae bacterium]